jgi:hypothetical protein
LLDDPPEEPEAPLPLAEAVLELPFEALLFELPLEAAPEDGLPELSDDEPD